MLVISSFCHILAVLFWLLFVWEVWGVALGKIALIGVIISGIILALEHKIVHKNFASQAKHFFDTFFFTSHHNILTKDIFFYK